MADGLSREAITEISKLARGSADFKLIGGTNFALIPDGYQVKQLADDFDLKRTDRPRRMAGTVKVHDMQSFCEYYTLFSDVNSRVFADEPNNRILAVLDYHGAGSEGGPRYGEHRLDFTMKESEEWKTWTGFDGQRKSQMDFAEFIEDNTPDIVTPSAATMLEVARDLQAKTDVDFGSTVQLANGSVQFRYSETVKGTFGSGNIDVPDQFVISIPVYLGCDLVRVTARLRYRINSGKLTFWFDLLQREAIERAAFYAARLNIADTLKITVISGVPA